jgi:quercetin dioxygenase-like cupin family protein
LNCCPHSIYVPDGDPLPYYCRICCPEGLAARTAKTEKTIVPATRHAGRCQTCSHYRCREHDWIATASSQFTLKVSPKNNGSEHLVAGTEELAPGATLPKHRHLAQDEIVLIQSGKAHVWLGDEERDLHAGTLVFVPANTWVSAKNIGTEPISLTFIFSAPGFEDTMRCNSVPAGETPTQITPKQQRDYAHLGHAENASMQEKPQKSVTGTVRHHH